MKFIVNTLAALAHAAGILTVFALVSSVAFALILSFPVWIVPYLIIIELKKENPRYFTTKKWFWEK